MEQSKENKRIADSLREAAALLEEQGANRFRVAAYRKAAQTLDSLPQDVRATLEREGFPGLTSLPGIGQQIGGAILEMIRAGRWMQLERLRGTHDPESLFAGVPGIGPKLARQVLEALHTDSLEGLEMAAYDGRLESVPGFGERRVAMVRAALADMLGRGRTRLSSREVGKEPPIDVLLEVDRQYREKAAANQLRRIAPKRFNPKNEAWLPVLHTERGGWHFSALFSNTPMAHSLGRTHDWIVIYFHDGSEGQRTVVTETKGELQGKRVVRGRERECADHYRLLWPEPSTAA